VDDGDVAYTIVTAAAVSQDPSYASFDPDDVPLINRDDDQAGVLITESDGSTVVTEGGAADSYTIRLTSQPLADVIVNVDAGTQVTTLPTSVTFNASNWNTPRIVTLTAVNDRLVEGTHAAIVTHAVGSADPTYDGMEAPSVSVAIQDDDRWSTPLDFDGDGRAEPTVFRIPTAQWFYRSSLTGGGTALNPYGAPGLSLDVPLTADFDGDGKSDQAVFRVPTAQWFYRSSATGRGAALNPFGASGLSMDLPLAADFDGDGKADQAVFRTTTAEWFYRSSLTGKGVALNPFGATGLTLDVPQAADFDGDGKADQAVFRTTTAEWFYRSSLTGKGVALGPFGAPGMSMDLPLAADFDGDGKADRAVFRVPTAQWIYRSSATGQGVALNPFGATGLTLDVPVGVTPAFWRARRNSTQPGGASLARTSTASPIDVPIVIPTDLALNASQIRSRKRGQEPFLT
ncbi:MAG: FG-GAP repeat domain-containing protein, partial [Isosphaeraceae bacterium]